MPSTPIGAFIYLVQETVEEIRRRGNHNKEIVEDLNRSKLERLVPIYKREQNAGEVPYVVSLVGLTNVGKSTLMEALLGVPVAPRRMGPATAIPVEYKYKNTSKWKISVLHRDFRTEEVIFEDVEQLGQELKRMVIDVNKSDAVKTEWVTVSGPMNLLDDGLIMADTPGFGAAQIGEEDGLRQRKLEEFIARRVHRAYFCVAAGDTWAIQPSEKDFYSKIKDICGHVVVNKWRGSEDEKLKYKEQYAAIFPSAEFIFVNTRRDKDTIDDFRELISRYSTPEKRREMCDPELIAAWFDIHRHLEIKHRLSSIPWRFDSLNQFKEACTRRLALAPLLEDLNDRYYKPREDMK